MFLIEHHGKELLASHGIPIPMGVFVPAGSDVSASRIPGRAGDGQGAGRRGGRGKAGAASTRPASRNEVHASSPASLGARSMANRSTASVSKNASSFVHEAYVSLSVDGKSARIRCSFPPQGGVDVEAHAADQGGALTTLAEPEIWPMRRQRCAPALISTVSNALADAVPRLADVFLRHEATLLEVNPLFILADGAGSRATSSS